MPEKNTKTAKKTAKKTSKKAVTKTVLKKTSKKRTNKTAGKQTTKTTKAAGKSFSEKLAERSAIEKNTTVPTKLSRTSEQNKLILLSPYRYPLPVDTLAVQAARLSGVFFVAMGAFFTLFHSQYLTSDSTLAQLSSATDTYVAECESLNYDSTVSSSDCVEEKTIPHIIVTVEGQRPVVGVVTIKIDAEPADEVIVYAYNRHTQREDRIGAATTVSPGVWERRFDTTVLPDGEYKIRAYVKSHDSVHEDYSEYFVVENNPYTETEATDTTRVESSTNDPETSESIIAPDEVKPEIRSVALEGSEPVRGTVRFVADIEHAAYVNLRAQQRSTGNSYPLGQAYLDITNQWKFAFDSTRYVDGEYRISLQAFNSSGEYDTDTITFTIANHSSVTTEETIESVLQETTESQTSLINAESMNPEARVSVLASSPLANSVTLRIDAKEIQFAEVYAKSKFSATAKFLGLAKKVDTNRWTYQWDTRNVPNGEYYLHTQVRNNYGAFVSPFVPVLVYNPITQTTEESIIREEAKTIYAETEDSTAYSENLLTPVSNELKTELVPENSEPGSDTDDEEVTNQVATTLDVDSATLKQQLDDEFKRLAAAIRAENNEAISATKDRIADLIMGSASAAQLQIEIAQTIARIESDVEKTNQIIRDRTNEAASLDTDNDGITDYDEINLFNTNPLIADTDGDGFIDGAEILNGFDPLDDAPEVLVTFESPQETGIVREDILKVDSIVAVAQEPGDTDGVVSEAIISGTALPNSFITLYIFSTPIIVTIKTDADGSWRYRFDKELADGQHEVYIGVTDNAGKIIAKSEPLAFVKEAQAFTPVSAATGAPVSESNQSNLFADYWIYLVLSISVVAIGLVLILLGLHLDTRQKDYLRRQPAAPEVPPTPTV